MKKSVKVCLALFLAFAVLAQYSFSPQALFAYGLSNTDKAVQTEETSADNGQSADEQQATEATEPTDATEAAKPAGEDKEPAAGEEKNADKQDVKYPAAKFSEKAGDVTVNITAPEGALPEGATVKVEPVKAGEVKDAVDDLIDNGKVVKAVDITFYDKNGKEIEPNEKVSVTFASDAFKKLNDAQVVHINNEGEAETVKGSNVEGNKAMFKSDAFSIYVVVEDGDAARLLVKFTSGGTEVASMYVRKDDNMEQVVYDPGVGEIPDGVYFRGWTTDPNYTTDTDPMTIAEVRTDIASKLPPQKDGDTEIYYAMLFKSYTITYYDEYGISLGQQEVSFRADSADTAQSYTVNMAYTVQDTVHNFEGWKVKKGGSGIEGYKPSDNDGEGTFYENGTEITISGSVEFGVNAPLGHWLVFNENGKGATYNAPKFIHADAVTEKPCEDSAMSRYGYTFTGWYTDEACTTEFVFGNKLTDYTTVYAGWRANATANYTVIIWKQRSSDAVGIADANKKYDFAEAITGTGNVGAVITGVTQNGSNVNTGTTPTQTRNVSVNGTEIAYTGFHCDRYDTNVTINAEGTAVLNVYYDRNVITINYDAGNNNTILDENDGTYKRRVTYTGLYEAPLYFTWPTTYYDRWGGSHDTLWQYGTTTLSFIGSFKLPNPASVSISMTREGAGNYPRRFIQQNTDGSWPTEAHDTISMSGTNFTITDKYTGFTAYQYRRHTYSSTSTTGFEAWQNLGNPGSSGNYTTVNNAYQLEIRFARIKEPITYLDGVYVSGNDGEVVEESSHGELHQTEDIYYDADISAYGNKKSDKYYTPTAPAGYSDYVFDGWYADETCTVPYVWSTMPAEGVTVYAKWRQIQYRVFLHPNKPEGAAGDIDWGGNQAMNFRVSYGKTISEPTGRLNGYEFVGWYKDEACTQAFNGDAYVLNETNVTDAYNSSQSDYQSSDANRFWINKRFDIYAKWRATLEGASGIGVTYDLNGGSGSAGDTNTYVDGAWAPAAAAVTAPEGKQFGYWVVQTWNEDEGKYVDDADSVKVFPGNTFQVLKDNAKIEEITPTTEGGDTKKYTVRLKAVYIDSEEPTPTFITWFNNDGTAGYTNEGITTLGINESVPIVNAPTRDGYKFLGWSIFPEPLNYDSYSSREEALAAAQEWEAETANWTQNLDADDIDITYNSETGKYSATKVAANENTPYHAMFAVWEENDVTINYAVADDSTGRGTVSPTSETIKAASGTAQGSTATASSSTYIIDYWTCDDGTGHVGDAAHFTPTKNSDGVYEAHTYYAHFKLNETTVTVHHYLKGTETKVKDDDVRTETIGSNFSATPATTYDEKTLSVDTDTSDDYQNVEVTAGGLEITIYYTLPLTVTVADKTVTYNGSTQYGYGATVNDSVAVDGLLAGDSITAFNYTRATGKDARENPYVGSFSQDPVVSHGSDAVSYYVITPTPGKLTITKAGEPEIKVTDKDGNVIATGAEKVYDGTPLSATASASLTITEGDETKTLDVPVQYSTDGGSTWTNTAPSLTDVRYIGGEVSALTVQVKTNDPNFEEKTTSYTLKVTQRPITVSATDTKTYNGADQTLTITKDDAAVATDTTGVVSGETLTLTDATITGKAVDEYTDLDGDYTWSVAKADESDSTKNYTIEVTGKLTITKAGEPEIVVTDKDGNVIATGAEKVYDGTPLSATASASLTITEGDETKTLDVPVQYSTDGGSTWTNTAPSLTDVRYSGGEVSALTVQVKTNDPNFETKTTSYTLKVTPAPITVSDTASKVYNGKDQTLTIEASKANGVVNDEILTLTGATITGKAVGEYTTVAEYTWSVAKADESDSTKNYTIEVTGKLTITKAGQPEIVVTNDEDQSEIGAEGAEKVYDSTPLSATASASLKITEGEETTTLSVPVQYSIDGGTTWTDDAPSLTDVRYSGGEVSALTVQVKTNDPNFEEKTTSYTLKVTPAPIIVYKEDSKVYNGKNQTMAIAASDASGVVSGETLTLTGATITGKDVDEYTTLDGTYTWSVAKADESDSTKNYTIEVTGKLTITTAPAEELGLKAIDYEGVYDGKSHAASASVTVTEGTIIEYQVEGGEWTTTAPSIKDVGSQVVSVRATNANYETATATCTLKVKPKQVTVTADDKSKVYGDADPKLTAKEEGTINGDSLAAYYNLKREAGENVGTYVITFDISSEVSGSSFGGFLYVIGLADQKKTIGNYEVTFVDGTFKITPATLTITTPNARKVYDGTALTNANATITGLKNGDKATVTATGSQTNPGSSRNTYRINWGDTDPKNYTLKENFGTLTVTAAPTPGGGNPPGGGGGNPGVGPAPAAPAQVVVDNPTPTTVIDEPAPKAVDAYWALINLLCAIATALLSLIMLIRYFGKRRYEEEVMDPATGQTVTRDVDEQRKGLARIASLIPAIGAIIAFIVTEDMSLPMTMVDKWTILMVVILAIQVGVGIFAKIRDNNEEEEDDEAMA